ncbi:MAG: ornithine cyclodeaminase family protein [Chloroflexota bacterium]|nr:ornithine cyclodeaminase family protein [Chloroflexota bacterium]
MAELRWHSAADVAACVSMRDVLGAVREGFAAFSDRSAVAPVRTVLPLPEGTTLMMPAALPRQGITTVKVVSVYPNNSARGLPAILGLVAVLDAGTGEPLALMEGAYLTGLRTGAASGVATDLLSRPDARVLGLVGTGFQARFQAEAVAAVRAIEEVRVYGRDAQRWSCFVSELRDYLRERGYAIEVRAAMNPADAVEAADVVCAATSSSTPVFEAASIKAGTHINGVGSYTLAMREVPPELIRRARVFVDSREAAEAEAGDLLPEVESGRLSWSSLPEIGEVLLGTRTGRESPDEVTFFKSVGLAVQDAAAAGLVARRAREMGLGQRLAL